MRLNRWFERDFIRPVKTSGILLVLLLLSSLVLQLSFCPPTHAQETGTVIFNDGFESGDGSAWNMGSVIRAGTQSFVTSPVHSGNWAMECQITSPGISWVVIYAKWLGYSTLYLRAYVQVTALPADGGQDTVPVELESSDASLVAGLGLGYSGGAPKWMLQYMKNGAGSLETLYAGTPTANEWHCLEVMATVDASNGAVKAYVDGTELMSDSGFENDYHGQATLTTLGFDTWTGQNYVNTGYFDDAVVSDQHIGFESPPTFGNISTSTPVAGTPCSFNCLVSDDTNVSSYIFSTNNTGAWVNDTVVAFSSFYNSTAAWANVTKTLEDTVDDVVSYMWYANDTSNNWSSSDQFDLVLITPTPNVSILSPENTTYTTANVSLNFTINEAVSWMGYSLDGQDNVTIGGNTTLTGLPDGSHQVIVYASDIYGNVGSSGPVYFTVQTAPPSISVLSPGNTTYTTADVPLTFTTNETASWMGYSLDEQTNVTVTGNTTMSGISDGSHQVTVYANNTVGIMGSSETVYFTVESTSQVTFDQTGVSTDFTGTVVTIDGANYNVTDLPASFNWTIGSTHTFDFQTPLVANTNAKQYVWVSTTGLSSLQSDTITVTTDGSIIGNYKTQYYLTVSSPYDSPSPLSGWFDSGTSITESVASPVSGGSGVQYVCTGWSGTGSVPNSGTASSVTFTMDAVSTITWNWKTQYQVTFDETGVGSDFSGAVLFVDGNAYYSLPVSFWWDNDSTHSFSFSSILASSVHERYVWISTTGLSNLREDTLSVTTSGSVTGNYQTQYYVTFDQRGVGSDFTGTVVTIDGSNYNTNGLPVSFWWDSGSSYSFSFGSPLVVNASEQYNWTSTSGLTTLQAGSLSVTGSGSITGNYAVQNEYHADVAVTSIVSSKTVVGRGYSTSINVTVKNLGDSAETFNLTVYANPVYIKSQNVTLSSGNSANVTFIWNTAGFAYFNYTLSAYAWPVPGETNIANNNCTGGWVVVSIPGDVTGPNGVPDGKVDIRDVHYVAMYYGTTPSSPNWNSNADINGDGKVDIKDVHIAAVNYGQHFP